MVQMQRKQEEFCTMLQGDRHDTLYKSSAVVQNFNSRTLISALPRQKQRQVDLQRVFQDNQGC